MTVDMSQEEQDIFFCRGLQVILDKGGKKVKVLPVKDADALQIKAIKKFEATDEMVHECIQEGVMDALRTYIKKCQKEKKMKKGWTASEQKGIDSMYSDKMFGSKAKKGKK